MLSDEELNRILKETKPRKRDLMDHTHHAYYEAAREIAKRMKLPWETFSPLVEREARLRRLSTEFQHGGVQLPGGPPTRKQAEQLQAQTEAALQHLVERRLMTPERLERVLEDIHATYAEAREEGLGAPRYKKALLRPSLALHADMALMFLERLLIARLSEHSPEDALQFMRHSTKAYVDLVRLVPKHWETKN